MNERIKELIEKAVKTTLLEHSTEYVTVSIKSKELGLKTVQRIPIEFCERFAQLIIEECGDIADNSVDHGLPSAYIDEHFGVKYEL